MIAIIFAFIILVISNIMMWKEAMSFKKTKDNKHRNTYIIYLIIVISSILIFNVVTKQYLDIKAILDNAQTIDVFK